VSSPSSSPPDGPSRAPRAGESVEVWCPSLDRWVDGFSAVERTGDGIAVRRLSDDAVLPIPFDPDWVRPIDNHRRHP
jgi:hypothetical protein